MCGIAGSVAWRDHAALGTFDIAKLSYRGPDALVTVRSSEITQPPTAIAWKLAHARLSIIDLATTANQPMSTADGRYWLVCPCRGVSYVCEDWYRVPVWSGRS